VFLTAIGLGLAAAVARADAPPTGALRTADVAEHYRRVWRPQVAEYFARIDSLPREATPYFAADVKDGIFAFLFGLLDRELCGIVSGAHLAEILERGERKSRVPTALIRSVRRAPGSSPPDAWVEAAFTAPLKISIPYSILGYHPGSLAASETIVAREWRADRLTVPNPGSGEGPRSLVITDVTLWAIVEGEIEIDIDGWLDAIMGSRLDDTRIVGLADFRLEGERFGMALGYNHSGKPRSGALDLRDDEIRFPSPRELKAIARYLRTRVVRRLERMGLPLWLSH
jgi:hypothetical protein